MRERASEREIKNSHERMRHRSLLDPTSSRRFPLSRSVGFSLARGSDEFSHQYWWYTLRTRSPGVECITRSMYMIFGWM